MHTCLRGDRYPSSEGDGRDEYFYSRENVDICTRERCQGSALVITAGCTYGKHPIRSGPHQPKVTEIFIYLCDIN